MTEADPGAVYRQEAADILDGLEASLLDLEKAPDDRDLIDRLFRALHTLKGSGAMFGYHAAAAFLHGFETAFDALRRGEGRVSAPLIAVALEARDHAWSLIFAEAEADEAAGAALLARLQAIMADAAAPGPAAPAAPRRAWRVTFRLPRAALDNGANPALMAAELADLGTARIADAGGAVVSLDALRAADPLTLDGTLVVELEADCDEAAIWDVFLFVRDEAEIAVEALAPPSPEAAPEAAPATRPATAIRREAAAPSMRVSAERADDLMDRVGELVIAQSRLTVFADRLGDGALKAVAEDIERLTARMRDTTMAIRMVEVETLFGRFRRLVHDVSDALGKSVVLETAGGETELDKTVIERLADPLVHLIRNAVDHGLETPEERRAAGKPATGVLTLSAAHRGAEVVITLRDDGRGLDAAAIRARAEAQGLIEPGAAMTDPEIWRLIFAPGFSTRSEATELSGRGVGMDVVLRAVEGLRGGVDLHAEPGRGTVVTLRLPLTLAIIDGLLTRVGADRYVIPLAAIEECLELPPGADAPDRRRSFLSLRGELLPFVTLRELFGADGAPDAHQKVVVVASGALRVGLVVDQIVGANQTVIKQLSRLHAGLRAFSGATILGDGGVALILDVMALAAAGQGPGRDASVGRAA